MDANKELYAINASFSLGLIGGLVVVLILVADLDLFLLGLAFSLFLRDGRFAVLLRFALAENIMDVLIVFQWLHYKRCTYPLRVHLMLGRDSTNSLNRFTNLS